MANNLALIPHEYNGATIHQRSDGYWNATAMCQVNGKRWNDYWRLQETKEFLTELASVAGIPATELVQVRQGGSSQLQGTWVHRRVAIDLARWCSPAFAVLVNGWVEELLSTGRAELVPAPAMLTAQSLATCVGACERVLSLGGMEERDRILLKDFARDGMLIITGKHLQPPGAVAVVISNRCAELGYGHTTLQMDKQIGKRIAARYRDKHNKNPERRTQHVDGAPRAVTASDLSNGTLCDYGV